VDPIQIIILFGVGLVAGFSAGLIGIGGGLFYVLLYSFFLSKLNIEIEIESEFVRMVIANSILSTFFAALAASYKHYRDKNFYLKPVLLIGAVGLFSSIVITTIISKTSFYNRDVFAIVFTIAVIPLIVKMLTKLKDGNTKISEVAPIKFNLLGLFSGAGTALSGLGGSFITTPVLNGLFSIPIKKVVSISVGVIVIVAGGTSLFNLFTQNFSVDLPFTYGGINLNLVIPTVLGVLIAAPYGVKFSKRLSQKTIRILFLLFCFSIIIRNFIELLT